MKIYLIQHGEAKPKEEDPERPLTEKGVQNARKVAEFLKGKIKPACIYHSDKLRAKQTAEIFSEVLGIDELIEETSLAPMGNIKVIIEILEKQSRDLMIVGHLPHLSKLSSFLLSGDENAQILKFQMAGVFALEKGEGWMVSFAVIPELV